MLGLLNAVRRFFFQNTAEVDGNSPRVAPFGNESYETEELRIHVGLDFGTSSIKAAYRVSGDDRRRPIHFNHGLRTYPEYCLPAVAAFSREGELVFGAEAEKLLQDRSEGEGLRQLKMVVAGKYEPAFRDGIVQDSFERELRANGVDGRIIGPEVISSCFLAYAMRRVRMILANYLQRESLCIVYNINMPIDHVENNTVRDVFEYIFAWAEVIERYVPANVPSNKLLDSAIEIKDRVSYGRTDGFLRKDSSAMVFAVPEAVAQSLAYFRSLKVQRGIHSIIDIGAGTTDISIFDIIEPNSQSGTLWYSAKHIPIGTKRLEDCLIKILSINTFRTRSEVQSQLRQFCEGGWANLEQDAKDNLWEAWRDIWYETHGPWATAYSHHTDIRYFRADNVRIFICGGGSKIPLAKGVFQEPWNKLAGTYVTSELPEPENWEGGEDCPFYRFSVAYGLTTPIPELGRIVLPSDAPNTTPPPPPRRKVMGDGRTPTPGFVRGT